jgi:alanyl-tRNA synthetase
VTNVQKNKGGKYLHSGVMICGELNAETHVKAEIDEARRHALMRAHSATHLLHKSLRLILGDHIQQAGSLVEPDRLRFDFTHFTALTSEELRKVENQVNSAILDGMPIKIREMPIAEARKIGATALFGEKYGDTVRVVSMGSYSTELCGGTHLDNTAKAGAFNIVGEFSVASGVRRIEATVGRVTLENLRQTLGIVSELAGILKANNASELIPKLEQQQSELRELRRAVDAYSAREANGEAARFLTSARAIGDLKVLTAALAEGDADKLRQMGDYLRDQDDSVVAVLSTVNNGKNHLRRGLRGNRRRQGRQGRRLDKSGNENLRRFRRREVRFGHGRREGSLKAGRRSCRDRRFRYGKAGNEIKGRVPYGKRRLYACRIVFFAKSPPARSLQRNVTRTTRSSPSTICTLRRPSISSS